MYTRETRRKRAVNEQKTVIAPQMNNGKEKKRRRGDTTKREKAIARGVLELDGSIGKEEETKSHICCRERERTT